MSKKSPSTLATRFQRALNAVKAGEQEQARALCLTNLKDDPDHMDSLCLLATQSLSLGNYPDAEQWLRHCVLLKPDYTDGWIRLADSLRLQGRPADSEMAYRRALELAPHHLEVHFQLAASIRAQGRAQDAMHCYEEVVARHPESAGAHYNLANTYLELKMLPQAEKAFRLSLACNPAFAEALNNLGNVERELGKPAEAMESYRQALALRADFPEALNNLGTMYKSQNRLDDAAACLQRAIELKPDYAAAYNNLGNVMKMKGHIADAIPLYCKALEIKSDFVEAVSNLGAALRLSGRFEEAKTCFDFAMDLAPDYPDIQNNVGNLRQITGDTKGAMQAYDRALELRPDFPEPHNNRGTILQAEGKIEEAVACYRAAISHRFDYPEARNNLAMALLSLGDYPNGWREYEWRWGIPDMIGARRQFIQPQWRGEAATASSSLSDSPPILLIHSEQGFGDTLQFCRLASLATQRGYRVVMEVQKPLVRLVRSLAGVAEVVGRGDPLPNFDVHCPMLSLPLALGLTVDSIPAPIAYLHAEEADIANWRDRLAQDIAPNALKIGLVWAGNPRLHSPDLSAIDRRRSISPELLAPLWEIPGIQWFSLQKDGPKAPEGQPMLDYMAEMKDFADTAALVSNLDLVITVDTAVAHLAAALGRPVWIMDRFDCCWRWLGDRHDSPWYPNLSRHLQPSAGDWEAVVGQVKQRLQQTLASGSRSFGPETAVTSAA